MKKSLPTIGLLILALVLLGQIYVFAATQSLTEQVLALPENERSAFKAEEIAKLFTAKVVYTAANGDDVVIENVSSHGKYLQLFVRAWKGNKQYGFGKAGATETERVRIVNPPILVPDGTTHQWCNQFKNCSQVNNYKEDPEAAIKSVVEDMISLTGQLGSDIIKGSVGRTVDIIFASADGLIFLEDYSTNWSTVRDASAGNTTRNNTTFDSYPATGKTTSYYFIGRSFFTFDTSIIGSTQTISAAVFSQYQTGSNSDSDNDGNDYMVVVGSTPAATSTLVNDDYDQIGSSAYSDTIDIGSISSSVYNDFTFNATGTAAINKTGYTQIGAREGHDMINEAYVGSNNTFNYVNWYFSGQAGTTNDPKLTITHTDIPTEPTSLLTEGQTNPADVVDTTPEFSAIFNDPNAADTTAFYNIQVSTSSAFSGTFWDSTKTQMATTTSGNRSPDISYAGSALATSTTYYWRIKFWDSTDNASPWSTATSTFSLEDTEGGFTTIISDIDYGPHGKPTYIEYSSGVKTYFTYDAAKLYRLNNILTTSP